MAPPASILPVHHNQLTSGHDSGKPILVALVAGVATFVATITVASLFSQTPAGSLWSAPASVPAAHATRITTSTITSRPPSMHATASFQPSAHNNVEPPTTLLGYEGGAQSQLPQERPGTIRLLMPFVALFGAVATAVALFLSPRRSHEEEYAMLAMAGKKRGPSPLRAEKWDPSKGTNLGGLFGSSKTPTMGGSTTAAKKEEEKYYQDIEISSERGVDYTLLKQLLKDGEWEEADNEHRRLLIELAGPAAVAREYVWPTEVADIPEQDMKMLDTLWANYSGGKFGFSVQRKVCVHVDPHSVGSAVWQQATRRVLRGVLPQLEGRGQPAPIPPTLRHPPLDPDKKWGPEVKIEFYRATICQAIFCTQILGSQTPPPVQAGSRVGL